MGIKLFNALKLLHRKYHLVWATKKPLVVLHFEQEHSFSSRRIAVHNEPDWSSLTLPELLEKALEFGNKAYSGSLSTYAFLERALEKSPKHTDMTDEILNLADKAKQAYQLLAEVNRDITSLAQEFPKPAK
jgi:hypothetical protein